MCGISGFIDLSIPGEQEITRIVKQMSDALVHRGPDGDGFWIDKEYGVALGHRRLAIIDLSEQGRQPMESHTGRYVLSYNGEIYNFRVLRKKLEDIGRSFHGHSDTEILLASIEEWGLDKTLEYCNGMFAFALWDRKESVLHLARDRMGKKPLYYGWAGKAFIFASELKALHQHPSFEPCVNRDALALYCRNNYVPTPWSIYTGIYKLQPASYICLSFRGKGAVTPGQDVHDTVTKYWDIKEIAKTGAAKPASISMEEAVDALDDILSDAVSRRMISDVPLGAFLSGGIDSSLIVALMQKQSQGSVKTYSIGFENAAYNEAEEAKKIAEYLGTDHTEYYISASEALEIIPKLPEIFDEPFADPSQIPTWLVSYMARQHVTVALSGDGGDEGFAGYSRYMRGQKLANNLFKIPKMARQLMGKMFSTFPEAAFPGLSKIAKGLQLTDEDALYRFMMSYWKDPEHLVRGGRELPVAMTFSDAALDPMVFIDRATYRDLVAYLPDDILTKVDRASMAVSLEVRAPLLDYKVIEFSRLLPLSMKIQGGENKLILRRLLSRYVPEHLFDRPKQGFGIPHGEWIKGPLRDWAENLLDERTLKEQGFFNVSQVREKWKLHCESGQDWSYHLWGVLMFQAWYERWANC